MEELQIALEQKVAIVSAEFSGKLRSDDVPAQAKKQHFETHIATKPLISLFHNSASLQRTTTPQNHNKSKEDVPY